MPSSTTLEASSNAAGPSRSPIISHTPMIAPLSPSHPEFAELLTPARLRKKRRHAPHINVPPGLPEMQAGPSRQGYQTVEGDLYRGAVSDPTTWMANLEEDAVTIGGSSSTSSSSSWSLGSDIERGRKATMAALGRFGEAIGVRRGSDSSSDSAHELRSQPSHNRLRRTVTRTMTRRLSRSKSRGDDSPERPRREQVPKRREFTLLLPPSESPKLASQYPTPRESPLDTPPPVDDADRAHLLGDRLITSPVLPVILDRIRATRLASGMMMETPPGTPASRNRRGGPAGAPGAKRSHRPALQRGVTSFALPPVPRPAASRMQSRVDMLKNNPNLVRPKSVSDLMGLASTSTSSKFDFAEDESPPPTPVIPVSDTARGKQKACWWLDVSCPGWEDLRDIGELLALHPLTLEDVLQQDPREKLDFFEKLGYYFLVVRSLDESYFKYTPGVAYPTPAMPATSSPAMSATHSPDLAAKHERRKRGWGMGMGRAIGRGAARQGEKVEIVEDEPGKEGLEGVGVGAVDVYMVVFSDGIVTFHYGDISKHTKRVLDRIVSEASSAQHTSDWIAHGILDSIVDAFFPLIRYVDGEVDDIDSLTIDPSTDPRAPPPIRDLDVGELPAQSESIEMDEKVSTSSDGLKKWVSPPRQPPSPRFGKFINSLSVPMPRHLARLRRPLLYLKLFFIPIADGSPPKFEMIAKHIVDRSTMLGRMTKTRKLVSGLSRLLGAKHAVVARLRRRAKELAPGVDIYLGDVEDHILLLQTSLHHYEYILAHCQPAYLSHLSVQFSYSRGFTDKAILALSVVTISVMPMMVMIGLFSMNVIVPHNGEWANPHREPDGSMAPFHWFPGIVVMMVLIGSSMMQVIRYWRFQARTKWAMKRGQDLPADWDIYWGWN